MGRMIDTDAAYAVLTDYYHHTTDIQHAALREALGRVESVDAVPVRHGRWVRWHEETYDSFGVAYVPHCKCSECGMKFDPYIANYMNYCSNCGVKLDGKDGEQNG